MRTGRTNLCPRDSTPRSTSSETMMLKQLTGTGPCWGSKSKVLIGDAGGNAPPWSALQEALLNEVGFEYVFNGIAFFTNCCGQIVDTHRSTTKLVDYR